MSELRTSKRLAEKRNQKDVENNAEADEKLNRPEMVHVQFFSDRSVVDPNDVDKSTRESMNADSKKNYSVHGKSHESKKVSTRSTASSRRQKQCEIEIQIKKKRLEVKNQQEVLKKQQEILDLELAMKPAQIEEIESVSTYQDKTGSDGYKESVASYVPNVHKWMTGRTPWDGNDKAGIFTPKYELDQRNETKLGDFHLENPHSENSHECIRQ
ncbi:uncharacterized protein [Leptinotarsa decemlineata]|uniref:uncharacterized protein n=1 Tax=Leptinotarsa decemlineata TaxID=7539 RepID=UPI003D3048AA